MNNYVTDAINLKSYNLNDADKIIVMYSKDNGLIKGVAKGIKKPKSKLGARMDLLVANSLQLLKGRSMDTIIQAQTLNNFKKTREDIDKLMLSSYISELVVNFGEGSESASKEIYDLFGVKFVGNDELKRLYMPESWEGHPLRKDYTEKDERLSWND